MFPSFKIKLPATSANLGPGFDSFGLAIQLYNYFTFSPAKQFSVHFTGLGDQTVSDAEQNLVIKTYKALCALYNHLPQAFVLISENHIPLESGLGSSATAIIAGSYAFRRIHGKSLGCESIANDAVRLERHADNIGASLYGGFTLGMITTEGTARIVRVPVNIPLACLVVQPNVQVNTEKSRSALPKQLSRDLCISNIACASGLIFALTQNQPDLLFDFMDDYIHQPHRVSADFYALKQSLRQAGALGVSLSGSGPSMLILYQGQKRLPQIKASIESHFANLSQRFHFWEVEIDYQGLQVIE